MARGRKERRIPHWVLETAYEWAKMGKNPDDFSWLDSDWPGRFRSVADYGFSSFMEADPRIAGLMGKDKG